MSAARIRKVVIGVHMGLGHDGLHLLLKKNAAIDTRTLEGRDLVMCLNKAGDKLKVVGCQGRVLGYLKMPKGQRIMSDALQYIPETFGGTGFDYDAACKRALETRLAETGGPRPPRGPLAGARARVRAGV